MQAKFKIEYGYMAKESKVKKIIMCQRCINEDAHCHGAFKTCGCEKCKNPAGDFSLLGYLNAGGADVLAGMLVEGTKEFDDHIRQAKKDYLKGVGIPSDSM